MQSRNSNKFNFFVSCDSLQKGKSSNGEDVVIIDGIASTSSVADSDQETLHPIGFNVKPFLESGLVNFNHQGSKDSNANIGVPLEAKIINDGRDLYVKCMLWPCPQTDGIVRAYENFKKYNLNRAIGFSIEGNSVLRGHSDKSHPGYKQILKADIHGIAVTFSPKNKNTLMNIVKANYTEAYQPLTEDDEINMGTQTCPKCSRYRLTKGSCSNCGYKEKSMDMAAIGKTVPEDVEHDKNRTLSKSEVCLEISKRYPELSAYDKLRMLELINRVNCRF